MEGRGMEGKGMEGEGMEGEGMEGKGIGGQDDDVDAIRAQRRSIISAVRVVVSSIATVGRP